MIETKRRPYIYILCVLVGDIAVVQFCGKKAGFLCPIFFFNTFLCFFFIAVKKKQSQIHQCYISFSSLLLKEKWGCYVPFCFVSIFMGLCPAYVYLPTGKYCIRNPHDKSLESRRLSLRILYVYIYHIGMLTISDQYSLQYISIIGVLYTV